MRSEYNMAHGLVTSNRFVGLAPGPDGYRFATTFAEGIPSAGVVAIKAVA